MKYLWVKTVNGDEYRSHGQELNEQDLKAVKTLLGNLARLASLTVVNPTIFTKDGDVEEVIGDVYLNPANVIHAFLSDK